MSVDAGWCISESDDDWEQYTNSDDPSDDMFIPKCVAQLLPLLTDRKALQVKCYCPRLGEQRSNSKDDKDMPVVVIPADKKQLEGSVVPVVLNQENSFGPRKAEAFDFHTEDIESPSAKRKTPSAAKRIKKDQTASMTNVMNDLIRHKRLDEIEASKEEVNQNDSWVSEKSAEAPAK